MKTARYTSTFNRGILYSYFILQTPEKNDFERSPNIFEIIQSLYQDKRDSKNAALHLRKKLHVVWT